MAQAKINGSTDWPMASNKPNFTSDESGGIPATLVIHDDKHERVFTESEVRAMLKDVRGKLETGWVHPDEITSMANNHGIVLDPA